MAIQGDKEPTEKKQPTPDSERIKVPVVPGGGWAERSGESHDYKLGFMAGLVAAIVSGVVSAFLVHDAGLDLSYAVIGVVGLVGITVILVTGTKDTEVSLMSAILCFLGFMILQLVLHFGFTPTIIADYAKDTDAVIEILYKQRVAQGEMDPRIVEYYESSEEASVEVERLIAELNDQLRFEADTMTAAQREELVTPRMNSYLARHPDKIVPFFTGRDYMYLIAIVLFGWYIGSSYPERMRRKRKERELERAKKWERERNKDRDSS